MTTSTRLAALSAAALAVVALAAAAEAAPRGFDRDRDGRVLSTATPIIDARIARQSDRIAQGVGSGALTRFEAMGLRRQLFGIRIALGFAKADGRVTEGERSRLNSRLDDLSARIFVEKHDRDGRRDRRG